MPRAPGSPESHQGRLMVRPASPPREGPPRGLQRPELQRGRDVLVYVPEENTEQTPSPLVVMLHGAGGNAQHGISPFIDFADEYNTILLAPQSDEPTWDVIVGGYGPDVAFIDHALGWVFERHAVDASRVAVEGFSDGASYALSLALTNGDLFTHVIAFAPGFMAPAAQVGAPSIFVTHGVHDQVLPIDRCSRRLVPKLRGAGYDVHYEEFDGPHTVPPELARRSLEWLVA